MATPSSVEDRRSPRFREANPIRLEIASERYGKVHEAVTMDEALDGVRIRIDVPLSAGERVIILPEAVSEEHIRARVVWVRELKSSTGYVAGLEFVRPLKLEVPRLRCAA